MATEQRLIDATELDGKLEALANKYAEQGRYEVAKDYSFVQTVLLAAPTVDAVEVVRCKDCRFCKKHPTSDKAKICTNERWNTEYHPFAYDDDFCSYGERRTDNEKS